MNSRSVTLRYLGTTKPPQLSCGGYRGCGRVFEQMMKSRHARRSTQIVSSLASAFINPGLIYQKSSLRSINMSDYRSRSSSSNKKSNDEKAEKAKLIFHNIKTACQNIKGYSFKLIVDVYFHEENHFEGKLLIPSILTTVVLQP